jgi:hypothetical protein
MSQDPVLITGAAGFIGFALAHRLLQRGRAVVGLDSVNDYYDPALKNARVAVLGKFNNFNFHKIDLADRERIETVFRNGEFGPVVHLVILIGEGSREVAFVEKACCRPSQLHRRLRCPDHHGQRRGGSNPALAGKTRRGGAGGPVGQPHCPAGTCYRAAGTRPTPARVRRSPRNARISARP